MKKIIALSLLLTLIPSVCLAKINTTKSGSSFRSTSRPKISAPAPKVKTTQPQRVVTQKPVKAPVVKNNVVSTPSRSYSWNPFAGHFFLWLWLFDRDTPKTTTSTTSTLR